MRDQKVNICLDRHLVASERAVSQSMRLLGPVENEQETIYSSGRQQTSFLTEGNKINSVAAPYESSLFTSSLSELFSRKLSLSSNFAPHGHSMDTVASNYEEPFESLEEIEAQTIGNLLPDDDDLFSGVTDGLEYVIQPSGGDDSDEFDLFSSVGGIDLGDGGSSGKQHNTEASECICNGGIGVSKGGIAGEHPHAEHPSRTLFVRNINSNVEDSELKALFEKYGDIRTLYTACKHRGFVMITYYDIRAARNAMKELQNKPVRRRKLDIHYSIPKQENPSEKDINQGTLVVFNLDSSLSNNELQHIFGVYGEIKEIRESPQRSHPKFIEFYDTRDAKAALQALNKSDIAGKQIKIETSNPGSSRRLGHQFSPELEQNGFGSFLQQSSPPNNLTSKLSGTIHHGPVSSSPVSGIQAQFVEPSVRPGISSSVPNSLPSLLRVKSVGTPSGFSEISGPQNQLTFDFQKTPNNHSHSLPEYQDGITNDAPCNSSGPMSANLSVKPPEILDNRQFSGVSSNGHVIGLHKGVFGSASSGSCPLLGNHYLWSNSYRPRPQGMWRNPPAMVNGTRTAFSPARGHRLPRAPFHTVNTVLPMVNHHVGSAPTTDPSVWGRQHAYATESPEASGFHPGSLGSSRIPDHSLHSIEFFSRNLFPQVGGNCMDMPIASKNIRFQSLYQRSMMFTGRGQMIPQVNSFDASFERPRSRRNEGSVNQADKKQYELDIERIRRGDDNRTTLMIKNIPNKYTSKMLLAAIDECHKGTYDFIYLPIDFKNKCNVGYAFINMTDPSNIVAFYQTFNGKKWEKFNSEKVASLAYARIQGKSALIAHFQNSSLMNEDKRCRPILFNTDGPNAGDQVPFPMGVNVRTRPGKTRTVNHEENHQGSSSGIGEGSSNGDTWSGSAKESA